MADPRPHDSRLDRDQVVDERPAARPGLLLTIIVAAAALVALAYFASLE